MPSDDAAVGSPEHWLARARGHLLTAGRRKLPGEFWEDRAFHAQQAAELAIKAVYQSHNLAFRFTHNLDELARGLQAAGVDMPPDLLVEAATLTRYAVHTRYPGLGGPVTRRHHAEAVRIASAVLAWAEEVIKQRNKA